jgi:epoxide hydrolase-like predicted phosphatase
LFDFGGVFTPSPFEVVADAARQLGVAPHIVTSTCFGGYDRDTDHPWHRLERGEVTAAEALAAIRGLAAEAGYDIDPIAVLGRGMGGGRSVRQDVVDLAREVRARGLKSAIVTNNVKEFGAAWRALLPLDELFDLVVDSCEEGIRKPDPRIFRLALARLGDIAPERAVFLDDAPGNIAAAHSLGMRTIHVAPDHAAALGELRALLAA